MNNIFQVQIGDNLSYFSYLNSYKTAFETLMAAVKADNSLISSLASPILFLARHAIELGFKTNIRYFSKYSGKADQLKAGHQLEGLFGGFKTHIESTIENLKQTGVKISPDDTNAFNKYCADVETLKEIFHKLDKYSDSFRYPVDKNGNPSFLKGENVDLLEIEQLFTNSIVLFQHTASLFGQYTDLLEAINNTYMDIYNNEMFKNYSR